MFLVTFKIHIGNKAHRNAYAKKMEIIYEEINKLDELKYINDFNNGIYDYKTLFNDYNVNDVSMHPMAIWKIKNINNSK